MTMARVCSACKQLITQQRYLKLQLRVLDPQGPEEQDEQGQSFDDYCDECIVNGKAVADCLTGLPKYRVRHGKK